ncbi:hypothetical protein Q8A67_002490 [Cirrhinus molitorella]|uniref:CD44 antigen n=1 Tax=Cirrhinus molitorella TaxID=172907 RepID=A0AA88Q8A0_9TELE|nr:hypothetical protein Q8A67_002490 [Cirrhinus molitorella]
MWTLLLVVFATGSPALIQAAPVQGSSSRCGFAGVFHVEGTSRYSLTFQQGLELCQSLGYKLATQEQVNDAYKKGLRTCRYGWIDGQNVMFLPHVNGPNCDSSSTEVTFHPEAAEHLSDVYCFNPSDEKAHEDIFAEVKTEGFLLDVEEIMGRVKREISAPKTDEANPDEKPPMPALDEPSTMTHNEDSTGPTSQPHFGKSSSSVTPSVLFNEGSGSGSDSETLFAHPEPRQFAITAIATEAAQSTSMPDENEETPIHGNKNQLLKISPEDTKHVEKILPTAHIHKESGLTTWLIIFAFCAVVGAIVCILAAIATRDKWYGPRQSRNITTDVHEKNYSKSETLPLSDKEQEIVALMSVTKLQKGQKEDTAASLDECEKEYLM